MVRYTGEFLLGNRHSCYPLTITDFATRYLITCEALSSTQDKYAFAIFERAFKDFGLPRAIRRDNGLPFASPNALDGLSRLSVWWLRLGILIERIKPGHPEQNGRHERMDFAYPFHEHTITVTHCGRICVKGRKINLSHVFAGQNVGVTQVSDRVWLVTFMHYDVGYFDDEAIRLEPIDNPFAPKVLPMCSE